MRVVYLVKAMQDEFRDGVVDSVITQRTKTKVWAENIKGKTYSIGIRVIPSEWDQCVTVVVTRFTNGLINHIDSMLCGDTVEAMRAFIMKEINSYRNETWAYYDDLIEAELELYS